MSIMASTRFIAVMAWATALSVMSLAMLCTAYGEEPSSSSLSTSPSLHEGSIEHIEITLPQQLLPGYPVLVQSLSMDEAVEIGLSHNLDIRVSDLEKDIEASRLGTAKAQRWPTVSVGSLSFLRGGDSQLFRTPAMMMRTVTADTFSQEFSVSARMPLFTGGRIQGGIQASRHAWQAADETLKNQMVQVAYEIRKAYLQALLIQAEHHVHMQHRDVQKELLRIVKTKYLNGKALKADVLRIQAERASADQMLNNQHNKLNQSMFSLKAVMGIDLGSKLELAAPLSFTPWQGKTLKPLVQEAITAHPEIQKAEQKIHEAQANIKVAKSQYMPQVYGQVSGNFRIPEGEAAAGLGNGVVGFLNASLPVLDPGRHHDVNIAQAQLLRAQTVKRNVEIQVTKEIAQAWSEMEFTGDNVRLSEAAVSEAQESLRLMKKRFEVGRALNVEAQDAILTLLQAQLNYHRAVYEHELAKAKVKRATGTL